MADSSIRPSSPLTELSTSPIISPASYASPTRHSARRRSRTPPTPTTPRMPLPKRQKGMATHRPVPRYSRGMKLEYIQEAIKYTGWSFTDLLDAFQHNQNDIRYRRFWLQYRRHAYSKEALNDATMQAILKTNGVDEVARFFRKELDKLGRSTSFGQYHEPTVAGDHSSESDGSLDFLEELVPDAQQHAPQFMRFLKLLSKPVNKRGEVDPSPKSTQIIWTSMFLYSMRRKKCNNIPKLIGLYCLQSGVKKRVLDILARIGVCTSYTTTLECQKSLVKVAQNQIPGKAKNAAMCFAHDNFDFSEQPSSERLGDRKTFVSFTNGIIFENPRAPKEGLKQTYWNPSILLSASGVVGNIATDPKLYKQVRIACEL